LKSEKNVKIHIVEHWSQLRTWTLPGEQTDSRQVLDAGDIARSVPRLASSMQAPVRTVVSHLQQDVGKSRNVTATLWVKKQHTKLLPITSRNVNGFS